MQNKAVQFITSTSRREGIRSQFLHNRIKLEPINIHLSKQAENIWNNIQHQFRETYAELRQRLRFEYRLYSSSILKHNSPEDPLYT